MPFESVPADANPGMHTTAPATANSAAAEGLYTCTPVGEPQVFETLNDPNFGHTFRAMATVSCTP